jgi:chitinase
VERVHTGIEGNDVADKLTREAAQDVDEQNIVYDRIPTTTVATEIKMKGLVKWQTQWDSTEKEHCADRFSHW